MMKEQLTINKGRDIHSSISSWIDGELNANEVPALLDTVVPQSSLSSACEAYWLVGDVLREDAALSSDFTARVMAAIRNEPTVLAPVSRPQVRADIDSQRWMPIAAAVAGVMVVGWMALSLNKPSTEHSLVATQQSVVTPVVAPAMSSARGGFNDDRAYMMAHQAYGSGAAMPSVAMYIRTVGDERLDTGR